MTSTRNDLRRLDRPKSRAVERALNQPAVRGFLDGVRHRLGRHGRAGFVGRLTVAAINSSLVQGRAASWIATISAVTGSASRPFQTESCRSAPPATMRNGF